MQVIIKINVSNSISGGVLSPYDNDSVVNPLTYFPKTHSPVEWNDDIYDNIILILVLLEEWKLDCERVLYMLRVITEYKNLSYFITKMVLNRPW